ncbi:MAG TPA: hypothetical protein VHE30_16250 [Polyangiaceae bacterium]|nr:hypothetical protein [Polyangiaceae bacterium]
MKPGDHPDFFRLPPPPGRSRESRIVLDETGRFWNGGALVDHEGMALAFASWITRHPDDGRFILTNGYDWTYFTVKDAPYFVRHVGRDGERAVLSLFDGTEEPLDPEHVTVSDAGVLYARVHGDYEARFTQGAQAAMVDFIGEGEDGSPCIEIAGVRYPIRPRPRLQPSGPADSAGPSPN